MMRRGAGAFAQGVAIALALLCASAGPAAAQAARDWTSPDGYVQMTLPERFNFVEPTQPGPGILFVVRSLGMGPAGPAEIVCAAEKRSVPEEEQFSQAMVNALTNLALNDAREREGPGEYSVVEVSGVAVARYELADRANDRLRERRFAVLLHRSLGGEFSGYTVECAVRTVRPAEDADLASVRAFLASLEINEPAP